MRYVDAEEMRRIDVGTLGRTWCFPDVPAEDALVKLASLRLAGFIAHMCGDSANRTCVHVVFGSGNNGADAVYAGLELEGRGFRVKYYAAFAREKLGGAIARLEAAGALPAVNWCGGDRDWTQMPAHIVEPGDVVVDGILGLGFHGAPRGYCNAAIEWINRCGGRAKVVAVDLPSGLDADTGDCPGAVVEAGWTVCMGMPKKGMMSANALRYCGSIHVVDLGMDGGEPAGCDEMVAAGDVARLIPPRRWDANKGDFGHVCVVGGAQGFCGAVALAVMGALRGGVGLISALVPHEVVLATAAHAPEAMVWPVDRWGAVVEAGFNFRGKTLVVGPGMTRTSDVHAAVRWLLTASGVSGAVLDADALNVFEGSAGSLRGVKIPVVITPHPGEAARLLGVSAGDVQADRAAAARRLAETTGAVVVLKGAGTLVVAQDKPIHMVPSANPGMASGGMGDVLAGLTGALLARGLGAFDAARSAAWIHSCAGDIAAWRLGRDAMLATDVAAAIGEVMRALA